MMNRYSQRLSIGHDQLDRLSRRLRDQQVGVLGGVIRGDMGGDMGGDGKA